jgi:hypothetical protein
MNMRFKANSAEYLDGDDPKCSGRRPADGVLNEVLK